MLTSANRHDDGRRHMAKMRCPICGKRVIDFSDVLLRKECILFEYTKTSEVFDFVITCPNRFCGKDIALFIKALHSPKTRYVNVPFVGNVIS